MQKEQQTPDVDNNTGNEILAEINLKMTDEGATYGVTGSIGGSAVRIAQLLTEAMKEDENFRYAAFAACHASGK